jgi:hypothetical protein
MLKIAIIIVLAASLPAEAQDHHAAHAAAPEVGGTTTLTAAQVKQLLDGDGMGLAKPAELNQYPGPKHLLELAADLNLSPEQRREIERIRAAMLVAAQRLGAEIVEAERALDAAFRRRQLTEAQLREATLQIGRMQGELRAAHLVAHLHARAHLSDEQISKYAVLRGHAKH